MKEVFEYLDKLKIKYNIIYHPPVYTTEQADKYIEKKEVVLSKSLFMTSKKNKNYYLFIMKDNIKLNIKNINQLINDKLQFATEEELKNKMNLTYGAVSLFGLLNNKDRDIKIFIDKDIVSEKIITFHPNDNKATIFISITDMFKVLDKLKYKYEIIDLKKTI